jgi:hypothetical protein
VTEEVQRVTLTEQELFDRLVELLTEQLVRAEDIKQLKKDAKFNKKTNPNGIPAADLALVAKAAALEAQNVFEEFAAKNAEVTAKFKELSGYED